MGSLMVVWFEGDVEKAFADLATDDSEYTTWFRARVLNVTGGRPGDTVGRPASCSPHRLPRLTCDAAPTADEDSPYMSRCPAFVVQKLRSFPQRR
jgi:hypothetical protein